MDKYFVTIISYRGESKFDEWRSEPLDSIIQATRCINTYKPKRGYKVVNATIDVLQTLV